MSASSIDTTHDKTTPETSEHADRPAPNPESAYSREADPLALDPYSPITPASVISAL